MRVRQSNYELRDEVPNFGASEVRKLTSLYTLVIVLAQMAMSEHSELDSFMENLNGKLHEASIDIIRQTVEVNGFTSRLQIKLISERDGTFAGKTTWLSINCFCISEAYLLGLWRLQNSVYNTTSSVLAVRNLFPPTPG